MFAEVCLKSTNYYSHLSSQSRLDKETTKLTTSNGDICFQGLLDKSLFLITLQIGFQKINGQIFTGNSMALGNSKISKISINTL